MLSRPLALQRAYTAADTTYIYARQAVKNVVAKRQAAAPGSWMHLCPALRTLLLPQYRQHTTVPSSLATHPAHLPKPVGCDCHPSHRACTLITLSLLLFPLLYSMAICAPNCYREIRQRAYVCVSLRLYTGLVTPRVSAESTIRCRAQTTRLSYGGSLGCAGMRDTFRLPILQVSD